MEKLKIVGEWLLVLAAAFILFGLGWLMDRADQGPYHVHDTETVSRCEREPLNTVR